VNHAAIRALPAMSAGWTFAASDKRILRTRSGEPNGYFHGEVWAMRFALLSPASVASMGLRGLRDGLLELPKHGIVACTDAFVFEDRIPCYEVAFAEDARRKLPRVSLALGFKHAWSPDCISEIVERAPGQRLVWEDTNFRYCLREAKVEVDHFSGLSWDKAQLSSLVQSMVAANFSMHMHIFYTAAAELSMSVLLDAEKGKRSSDRRHKLAHLYEIGPEERRMACRTPYVHLVYQPMWFRIGSSYDEDAVRSHRELLENGAAVCYGSDWDISDISPLQGLRAVLSRDGLYAKEKPWPERLAEALRLLSYEAARSIWLEDCSGTLEVGKFADICILDKDLFEMPEDEFCPRVDPEETYVMTAPEVPVRVMATFSRGFCIFQRPLDEKDPAPLERVREPRRLRARDGRTETDEEFLCGTCTCAPAAGLCGSFRQCR